MKRHHGNKFLCCFPAVNWNSRVCSFSLCLSLTCTHTQHRLTFSYLYNHPHGLVCRCWMDLKNPPFSCYSYLCKWSTVCTQPHLTDCIWLLNGNLLKLSSYVLQNVKLFNETCNWALGKKQHACSAMLFFSISNFCLTFIFIFFISLFSLHLFFVVRNQAKAARFAELSNRVVGSSTHINTHNMRSLTFPTESPEKCRCNSLPIASQEKEGWGMWQTNSAT